MFTQPASGKFNPVPTNPIQKPASHFNVLFSYKPIILVALFVSVLILSTSFQSGRNEMVRIESEYLIPDLINGLKTMLSDAPFRPQAGRNAESIALYNEVRHFYMLQAYRPAWTSYNHLNRNGASLFSLIENAREYGLEPEHYHIDRLREIQSLIKDDKSRSQNSEKRIELEMLLTDAALKLMVNLHAGYQAFDSTLLSSAWIGELPAILQQGIRHGKPVEQILSVQPRFIEYARLQTATVNFVRNTSLSDDTLFIAETGKDSVEFYNQVKNALVRLGYAGKNSGKEEIISGLKEFQQHHGLESDGRPGKNTQEALQMTTLYHYRMLVLNLDRLRKQDNSEMHLLYVNIPAYQLKVFRQNKLMDIYRVIVGAPKTPTPQLVSKVERVIANPVWDVPTSIAQNELLPKIKADSGYLRRNRFRLVDRHNNTVNSQQIDINQISNAEYFIRQDASSDNALGKVKFIFSNPYSVYLHDTPGKTLFAKDTRDMSHGCVRLQNPERLAQYLVNIVQSDSTDIGGMIINGIHREINLTVAVPIHISYITCDADDKGKLYFYRDIYGIDEKELAELEPFMGI
jgi:murein L,D-transpeptidase YcbB/YkuD